MKTIQLALSLSLLAIATHAQSGPQSLRTRTSNAETLEKVGESSRPSPWPAIPGDGSTDALPALQAALNAVSKAGGGVVYLAPKTRTLIDSGNLLIPKNARLACEAPMLGEQAPTENWLTAPCGLLLNPNYTITIGQQGDLNGVYVLRKGWTPPNSMRTAVQAVAAYAGTGITIGGIDARAENVAVIGFAKCVESTGWSRLRLEHLDIDCTNGVSLDNSHDISRFTDIEAYPFGTGTDNYETWANDGTYAITGLANNGSGLIRATFNPGVEPPVNGDLIAFHGVLGVPQSARQRYTVTVVDSTHMDLTGSKWPGVFKVSANSTRGSEVLTNVSDASGIGLGMVWSGGNIPVGTTITAITQMGGTPGSYSVTLSAAATSRVSPGYYAVTPATTAGGQGYIDTTYRSGKAFAWTKGENNSCDHCFEFGYQIGYYIGQGAGWTDIQASSSDGVELEDPNNFGFLLDFGSYDTMIRGGFVSSKGHGYYQTNGPGPANKVSGVAFNAASAFSPTIEFLSGPASLIGCTLAQLAGVGVGSVVLAADASKVIMTGNDLMNAPIVAVNSAASARLIASANISGGSPQGWIGRVQEGDRPSRILR